MKKNDLMRKFFDLLQENLSPEEREKIITGLEESGISRDEIELICSVNRLPDEIHVPEPTERMDKRFYAMLEEEQRKALIGEQDIKPHIPISDYLNWPGLRIAAGISLFLLGWFASGWFGSPLRNNNQLANLSGEVRQLKETLVLTMMQQNSTVERIKAVNMVGEFDKADSRIIESLIKVLNTDSNDNVRLLALDALIRYSSIPEVREGLVASIVKQTSPMVQLRLAEIMLALNEKRAAPEFQKVLQNVNLNYSVRGKMNDAIVVLL
jgi:hypothetical protein